MIYIIEESTEVSEFSKEEGKESGKTISGKRKKGKKTFLQASGKKVSGSDMRRDRWWCFGEEVERQRETLK